MCALRHSQAMIASPSANIARVTASRAEIEQTMSSMVICSCIHRGDVQAAACKRRVRGGRSAAKIAASISAARTGFGKEAETSSATCA